MLSEGSAVPIEMHWGETRRVSLGNAGRQRHAGRAAATHCWNPRRKLLLKCSNVGNRASIEMVKVNGLGTNKSLANGSGAEFLHQLWGMCFRTTDSRRGGRSQETRQSGAPNKSEGANQETGAVNGGQDKADRDENGARER